MAKDLLEEWRDGGIPGWSSDDEQELTDATERFEWELTDEAFHAQQALQRRRLKAVETIIRRMRPKPTIISHSSDPSERISVALLNLINAMQAEGMSPPTGLVLGENRDLDVLRMIAPMPDNPSPGSTIIIICGVQMLTERQFQRSQ